MYLFEIIVIILSFSLVSTYYYLHEKNGIPTDWPVVGMFPALLKNLHRIDDYLAELMEKTNMTFIYRGPWFTNMHFLASVDPQNVHYVTTKNFKNYPKGSKLYEIFDVVGEGIINSDSTLWQFHRKIAISFFNHPNFHQILVQRVMEKVKSGLVPVLDHVAKQGIEVDLQNLFSRFTFDNICGLIMDYDPLSLSIHMPDVPSTTALDDIEETFAYRHALPSCLWKFQRWLCVGQEKKHKEAWHALDTFIYKCLAIKKAKLSNGSLVPNINGAVFTDILTLYMQEIEKGTAPFKGDKFLRDNILNYIIAGRGTTTPALTWFFYLMSKNPKVVSNIRKEVNENMSEFNNPDSSRECYNKHVYLHAALCEALRLYPPVVFEANCPIEEDTLPSGHRVEPHMQIFLNMYAMARMKSIWGDDCCEFKPERWISERGEIKYEPSFKFFIFNAGPRSCLGKNMAFTQMKAIVAAIVRNYHIEPAEGYQVAPSLSIMRHMKYGFKVRVFRLQSSP